MLLVIEIVEANVRIVCSNNYVPGNEFELADFFEIDHTPHFFPYNFLHEGTDMYLSKWNYIGEVPYFHYFVLPNDTKKVLSTKQEFFNHITYDADADAYCLRKELMIHASLKLHLLASAMLQFIHECFLFQSRLNNGSDYFVNPFNPPIISLGSLMYNIYTANYLQNYDICAVKNEYGTNLKQVSRIEHQFVSFFHYVNPSPSLMSAFSSEHGQKYFRESIPDLYCTNTKQCWYLMGCVIHGHMDSCLLNPNATPQTKNPFGRNYQELNDEFNIKMDNLILNNPEEVSEIILEWECSFKEKMKSPELKHFIDHIYIAHPLTRLRPRDVARGGFMDCYAMKWNSQRFPTESFYALDINSLYSECATFEYMTGKYKILMGHDLGNIVIYNNQFFYNGQRIMGSIFLQILPPKDLKHPFLMYRVNDRSYNTLCSKCAELHSTKCNHTDSQRALIASYMISEVEFALTLNYSILAIFEIHAYFSSDYILQKFVNELNVMKLLSSNCFQPHSTLSDKQQYCQKMNSVFNLTGNKALHPNSFKYNAGRRNFYKLASNTFFGKWSQRSDKGNICFVSSQQELENCLLNDKVEDVFCLSDFVCMVETSGKIPPKPDLKHNVYIGAQITAFGRQIIYTHLQKLLTIPHCTVYQVNCDSLYFSLPKDVTVPFTIDQYTGTFKHVYEGQILSYISFGPRQYCVHSEMNGNLKTDTRISGLSLNHETNNFDFQLCFKELLNKFETTLFEQYVFPKQRKKISKNLKVKYYSEKFSLNNTLSKRRNACIDTIRIDTLPYGWQSDSP
ncbi:MAG: hypothetical protein FJ333_08200 [Sphingomonadales bacterium]|nr:hypothetical protein [Sphingomonadales bacterium]